MNRKFADVADAALAAAFQFEAAMRRLEAAIDAMPPSLEAVNRGLAAIKPRTAKEQAEWDRLDSRSLR